MLDRKFSIVKNAVLTLIMCFLVACASTPEVILEDTELALWLSEANQYKDALPNDHPDRAENILSVSDSMREIINTKFSKVKRSNVATRMAGWLIKKDGHGMTYSVEANLSPAEAFEKREGNCLSFTLLLTTMAAELDIKLEYNEVDLPDVWNQNEEDNAGLVLYRHINAIRKTSGKEYVYDLAIEEYDASYPQRVIPSHYACLLYTSPSPRDRG